MPTLADVFLNQAAHNSLFTIVSNAELIMIGKRHNEVLQAVAEEHGRRSRVEAYALPDSTELGEKSLPIFEGLCRDLSALRNKYGR